MMPITHPSAAPLRRACRVARAARRVPLARTFPHRVRCAHPGGTRAHHIFSQTSHPRRVRHARWGIIDRAAPVALRMTDAIKIDVWSDIACPWCYIGKRNLEKGLAAASTDDDAPVVEVDVPLVRALARHPGGLRGRRGGLPVTAQGHLRRPGRADARSGDGCRGRCRSDLPLRPSAAHQHRQGARTAALREGERPPGRAGRATHVGVLHRGPAPRPRGRAGRAGRRFRTRCGCRARGAAQRPLPRRRCAPIRRRRRRTASTASRSS